MDKSQMRCWKKQNNSLERRRTTTHANSETFHDRAIANDVAKVVSAEMTKERTHGIMQNNNREKDV